MPFVENCGDLSCFVTGPVAYKSRESFESCYNMLYPRSPVLGPGASLGNCVVRFSRQYFNVAAVPKCRQWTCFGVKDIRRSPFRARR